METKLYKVLVDGKACHGGSLWYSLPKPDGSPGEWHEIDGNPVLCNTGFHLTDTPEQWSKDKCEVYEVEAEGILGKIENSQDRKVVAKRVRLLRKIEIPSWIWYGYGSGSGYGDGSGYGSGCYGSGSGYGYGYGKQKV